MKLRAFDGKIIVERLETEKRTTGGLAIPDDMQKKSFMGRVCDISKTFISEFSNGDISTNDDINIGDMIYFEPYTGNEIEYESKKYIVLRRKDILAVIYKPPKG